MSNTEFVAAVKEFNDIAGNTGESFNQRKAALYMGLIFEELGEMVESINGDSDWTEVALWMAEVGNRFKAGNYDVDFENVDREAFLDAAVDIAVVSLGAGIAVGADIEGACNEVAENNLSKFPIIDGKRTVLKDDNGKVKKPEGYQSVSLSKFLK